MSIAIRVENLSKHYRLGLIGAGTLSEDLSSWWARARGQPDPQLMVGTADHGNRRTGEIWALRDLNFEVREGEILGIIGRNGAGKSTLLKIISRITVPSVGMVKIRGRVGSLLEVGTGFHPELTGRENIYLNGAILGMKKAEITRKLEEIIDFSGVEQFIDTPVKRYSSGMYVRLAFAVAAHLDSEILVLDEVLAVGDADFQRKCLGKIDEVSQGFGRTVLFVSHNMGMITSLCKTAILLEKGSLVSSGSANATVLSYYSGGSSSPHVVDFDGQGKKVGDHLATLLDARVEDGNGNATAEIDIRAPFRVKMRYALHSRVPVSPYPNFHFLDGRGEYVFVTHARRDANLVDQPGVYEAVCNVPGHLLNNGPYFIGLALTFTHQGIHISFWEKDALSVSIFDPIRETVDELRSGYSGVIPGPVRPQLDWVVERVS